MTLKLCTICGEPCTDGRCPDHRPEQPGKTSARARGYTTSWDKLSRRARALQPWCSNCGTKNDLTTDHLVWPARSLKDVDVLCRSCNAAKGAAPRTTPTRGKRAHEALRDPRGKANLLTEQGITLGVGEGGTDEAGC